MENVTTIEIFDTVENFKGKTAIEKKECFFILSVSELKNALSKLKFIVPKNNAIPILDCVKIEVIPGKLILTASDMLNAITYTMPAETKGNATFCVDFGQLSAYINNVPDGNILFSFDFSTNQLFLSRDNSIYKLPAVDPSEFSNLTDMEFSELLKIPANYFIEGLSKTVSFTGSDELRPVMSAICIEAEKDVLRFIATNAHKLAVYTVKNQDENCRKQ